MKGEKIRDLRVSRGMTQEALAKKIGVCRRTVLSWERGVRTPRFDVAVRLAEALGVSANELTENN